MLPGELNREKVAPSHDGMTPNDVLELKKIL